jgi:hypothetical protein
LREQAGQGRGGEQRVAGVLPCRQAQRHPAEAAPESGEQQRRHLARQELPAVLRRQHEEGVERAPRLPAQQVEAAVEPGIAQVEPSADRRGDGGHDNQGPDELARARRAQPEHGGHRQRQEHHVRLREHSQAEQDAEHPRIGRRGAIPAQ